jgi:hypothetical protein
MPWVAFEPTIPGSKRAKIVHALDRSATVTGTYPHLSLKIEGQSMFHIKLDNDRQKRDSKYINIWQIHSV